MPDNLDQLRVRFGAILQSPPCQKVDFWLGGLHVSGAGFTLIAHALAQGGRHGKGVKVLVERLGRGAAAQYDQTRNAIVVPRRGWARHDAFERLATVHEAVHALRDAHGKTLTYEGRSFRPRAATDEAAAYVAGCLFDVYVQEAAGKAPEARPAWLAARKSPTHAVAYAVARRQAAKPTGSPVDRADLAALFQSVTESRRKMTGETMPRFYDFDGIRAVHPAE